MDEFLNNINKIDSVTILSIIGAITLYSAEKISQKYSLKKEESKNFTIAKAPVICKNTNIDECIKVIESMNKTLISDLKLFIRVLKNNNLDTTLLFNNLKTIKLSVSNLYLYNFIFNNGKNFTVGYYDCKRNLIKLKKNYDTITLMHELFHCASSIIYNSNCYIGFSQEPSNIGVGLNEGYTEILTHRYFPFISTKESRNSYFIERNITSAIELIVGQDKMEKLYFSANLDGLVNELKKYNSYDDIISFILELDFLNTYLNKKRANNKVIIESLHYILDFIFTCLINKKNNSDSLFIFYTDTQIYNYIMKLKHNMSVIFKNKKDKFDFMYNYENKRTKIHTKNLTI